MLQLSPPSKHLLFYQKMCFSRVFAVYVPVTWEILSFDRHYWEISQRRPDLHFSQQWRCHQGSNWADNRCLYQPLWYVHLPSIREYTFNIICIFFRKLCFLIQPAWYKMLHLNLVLCCIWTFHTKPPSVRCSIFWIGKRSGLYVYIVKLL